MSEDLQARLEQERAKLGTMLETFREELRKAGATFGGGGLVDVISGIENLGSRLEQALRERDEAVEQRDELQRQAVRAAAELRHAFVAKDDWNLVARAIRILETATTDPHPGASFAALLREVLALRNGLKEVLAKVDAYNRDELHGLSSAVCAAAEAALAAADAAKVSP